MALETESLVERGYIEAATTSSSLYLPGLIGKDLRGALQDAETITDTVSGRPLATPIAHNSWYRGSEEYFTAQVACGSQDLYYYCGLPGVDLRGALIPMLKKLEERRGVLVFEHSTERPNDVLLIEALDFMQSGFKIQELHTVAKTRGGTEKTYYPAQYIYSARYEGGQQTDGAQDVEEILKRGSEASENDGVHMCAELEQASISEVYEGYMEAFSEMSTHSPISWTFDEERFVETMRSPRHLKYVVNAVGGGVLGMCVVSDIRELEWFNYAAVTQYIENRFRIDSSLVPIVACPLIYSRIDAPMALSRKLFRAVAKSFAAAGTDPVCVIECIDPNASAVTRLLELGTKNAGVSKLTVGAPVVRQQVSVLCQ